jgi:hypothetical protein
MDWPVFKATLTQNQAVPRPPSSQLPLLSQT